MDAMTAWLHANEPATCDCAPPVADTIPPLRDANPAQAASHVHNAAVQHAERARHAAMETARAAFQDAQGRFISAASERAFYRAQDAADATYRAACWATEAAWQEIVAAQR